MKHLLKYIPIFSLPLFSYLYINSKKEFFINYVTDGEYHYLLDETPYRKVKLLSRKAIKIYENGEKCLFLIDKWEFYFGKLAEHKKYYTGNSNKYNSYNEKYPIVAESINTIYYRDKNKHKIFNQNFYISEDEYLLTKGISETSKILTKDQIGNQFVHKVIFYDNSVITTDFCGNFKTNKFSITY